MHFPTPGGISGFLENHVGDYLGNDHWIPSSICIIHPVHPVVGVDGGVGWEMDVDVDSMPELHYQHLQMGVDMF